MADQEDVQMSIEDTLLRLLKALVRPHVEYGNIIRHPHYQIDKLSVEKVQRRAKKLVSPTPVL